MSDNERVNKILKELNGKAKRPVKRNDVFHRKVLVEKCYKGREMSEEFIKRIKPFHPNIHSTLDRLEEEMEVDLINFLDKMQISATKKTEKRSLPYTNVITFDSMLASDIGGLASDIGGVFMYKNSYRKILLDLLLNDVWKIRFYVHIESYDDTSNVTSRMFGVCGLRYCFRYYIH